MLDLQWKSFIERNYRVNAMLFRDILIVSGSSFQYQTNNSDYIQIKNRPL